MRFYFAGIGRFLSLGNKDAISADDFNTAIQQNAEEPAEASGDSGLCRLPHPASPELRRGKTVGAWIKLNLRCSEKFPILTGLKNYRFFGSYLVPKLSREDRL